MAGEIDLSSLLVYGAIEDVSSNGGPTLPTDFVKFRALEAIPKGRFVYRPTNGSKNVRLASNVNGSASRPIGITTTAATAANQLVTVCLFVRADGTRLRLSVPAPEPTPPYGGYFILSTQGRMKPIQNLSSGEYVTIVAGVEYIYDADWDMGAQAPGSPGWTYWIYSCPTGRKKP